MSSDPTQPTPAPQPAPEGRSLRDFWNKNRGALLPLVVSLASALIGSALTYFGAPPKVVERVQEILVEVPVLDEFGTGQGWVPNEEAIAENRDAAKTTQFAQTPAGKAALGDEDTFLYRAVRKAAKLPANRYPNVDQKSVGCCVGCGAKHAADASLACAIANGARFEWKPIAVEPIYAGSRVEVGGGRIRGDGSVGAWAAKWLRERGGLVPMEKLGAHDLTTFSPARARQWGAPGVGVPDDLEPAARTRQVKGAALVTTAAEGKRAIQQGYAIMVCSNVGFNNRDGTVGTRDAQGFCTPRGTWNHCMAFIGWRGGARPGFLCLNSWGDTAHSGPVWPEDMPRAAFWIDESVVGRMLAQGDSFALADVEGFPARQLPLDWFVRAEPSAEPKPFWKLRHDLARDNRFALAW